MLVELDGIVVEPTPAPTTVELDSLNSRPLPRHPRVQGQPPWRLAAGRLDNRCHELVCHDDDPAVAVVRDWLDSGRKADARDLVARIDAARADA